jgi:hypothetical protein
MAMASGEKLYPNTLTVTPPADFANSVRTFAAAGLETRRRYVAEDEALHLAR